MESQNPSLPDTTVSEKPGIIQRLLMVFYSPAMLFPKLTGKLDWILPLLVIALLGGLFSPGGYLVSPIVTRDTYPKVLANLEKFKDNMGAAQWEKVKAQVDEGFREAIENPFKWYHPLIYLAMPLVISMLIAVIGIVAGNFLFGGKSGYWIVLNVVLFSALIGVAGEVVRGLLIISKDSMYVYTGLGLLKPVDDGSFLYYFFRQIDLFSIWRIVVTSIGLGAIYRMKPKRFGYVLFSIWVLFVLLVSVANLFTGGSITY